ncbi:MAG: ferrous iron transport protein B [Phycisphaeraceae bacterium]|nr:ferrous iron transport protein B [Phycisphaeraceae bacterium]
MTVVENKPAPWKTKPATGWASAIPCVALVGNPNAGKTTLFNALTGLRAKTANFPGTTIEHRIGRVNVGVGLDSKSGQRIDLLDLPGLYGLTATSSEERIAVCALLGELTGLEKPDAVILIVDATNLERNLYLASQIIERGVPCVVALNMLDLAEKAGIKTDPHALSLELGTPVVGVVARTGRGVPELLAELHKVLLRVRGLEVAKPTEHAPEKHKALSQTIPAGILACGGCSGCPHKVRYDWAEEVSRRCQSGAMAVRGLWTERLDRVFTHPVAGVLAFLSVMAAVFLMIFWLAAYPMGWIDSLFGHAQTLTAHWLPQGDLRSLVAEGVIGGVGGMLVFLPQIGILFFFLSLLEDTGYLARAAFVMDRLMRRVGLPGKAFVPMLSAHACAIPAIMSTRVIEDPRDRLVTMLVLPLMSCSARIPVYAMVVALLFPQQPVKASLVFTGAYALGMVAAVLMALLFKRTILPGETKPLVLELPGYKVPSLRNAILTTWDRSSVFVMKAGTFILVVSVVLWALATYPKSDPSPQALAMQAQAQALESQGQTESAETLRTQADELISQQALANSAAGRLGHWIEPAIRPLGFDWQIGVGVVSSLAAREVIVSTLAIIYGVGADAAEENPTSLYDTLRQAKRTDGSPVFSTATCLSMLVFYVLAMQCLATQAVTRRETNSWKWPAFQFTYMTVLAYVASLATYQIASLWIGA